MKLRFFMQSLCAFCLSLTVEVSAILPIDFNIKDPKIFLDYIDSVKTVYGQGTYRETNLYRETINRIQKTDEFLLKIFRKEEYQRQLEVCSLLTEAVVSEIKTTHNETSIKDKQRDIISHLQDLNVALKKINSLENRRFQKELEKEQQRVEKEQKRVEEEKKRAEQARLHAEQAKLSAEQERQRALKLKKEAEEKFKKLQSSLIQVKNDARGTIISMSDILFKIDKADLTPQLKTSLAKIAGILLVFKESSILIEGHTDNTGTEEYNLKLSQRRAQNVLDFLVDQGIAESRLHAEGYGLNKPLADNSTKEGRKKNRRVDLVIQEMKY